MKPDVSAFSAENSELSPSADLNSKEFQRLREIIYKQLGISLADQKKTLVSSRLGKLLRRRGLETYTAYCDLLEADKSGLELSDLADAISTNHTFFNREHVHFEYLVQTALPIIARRLEKKGEFDLRLWCAASSTGQEPYMLAMLLRQFFGSNLPRWNAGLLATDISDRALTLARNGIYSPEEAEGLPIELGRKYFKTLPNGSVAANDQIKSDIVFRRFNLIRESYPFKKPFHIIFCRNVLIYFDPPTKEKVIQNMADSLESGGYLFLGHAESLGRENRRFSYLQPAVYRKE